MIVSSTSTNAYRSPPPTIGVRAANEVRNREATAPNRLSEYSASPKTGNALARHR